jgi:glycosyltransferase involved in cell wall biosynthesis
MQNLSVISHFYNGHEWVDKQIAHWEKLKPEAKSLVEFILVDDHSDQEYTLPKTSLNIRLFRVIDDIPWNQAGARNLAVFHASGVAGLFIDIDQFIYTEFLERLIAAAPNLERDTINFFRIKELVNIQNNQPMAHHPNSFVVNLPDFKRIGMYDEDFVGHYGFEDVFLMKVWESQGGRMKLINEIVSENLPFGTSSLNRDIRRNQQMIHEKVFQLGCRNSHSIMRFHWVERFR